RFLGLAALWLVIQGHSEPRQGTLWPPERVEHPPVLPVQRPPLCLPERECQPTGHAACPDCELCQCFGESRADRKVWLPQPPECCQPPSSPTAPRDRAARDPGC